MAACRFRICSSTGLLVLGAVAMMMMNPLAGASNNNDGQLSLDFYKASCPQAESIVFRFLNDAIAKDIGLAAALLRIHFHDCFVQGCDGSVLLDTVPNKEEEKSEKEAPPNLTLRKSAFKAINDIRDALEQACGLVVSCADIVTLAARDSVHLAGGPRYDVPLGRFDSLTYASTAAVLDALPPPSSDVTELMKALSKINLDITDLVALSGAHTLGIAHCNSFDDRLFPPTPQQQQQQQGDASQLDKGFADHLKLTCPVPNIADNFTVNDIRTPNLFDNKYYVNLLKHQGLFTSDQVLNIDARTKNIVAQYAVNQSAFFEQFKISMVKMGQIQVLNRTQGQIRKNCSVRNNKNKDLLMPLFQAAEETIMMVL